jgi:CHAT domain-containing protein
VSGLHCDALLLADGDVRVLPLPLLGQPELLRHADEFRAATRKALQPGLASQTQEAAHRTIRETLAWLWSSVAEPVLEALDLRRQGDTPLSRLWWVPTGALTGLPLHAAGAGADSVLDHVISSYAPTVRSLVASPEPARRGVCPSPLIVSVPAAPGLPPLPHVRTETTALRRRFQQPQVLYGDQAVRQAVLDALPQHSWVHFACHAVGTDGIEPGRLLLHDHASAPLTVGDLARLHLEHAELVFLSACETSVGREELDDEAFHIAGTCRMAGFRALEHRDGRVGTARGRV